MQNSRTIGGAPAPATAPPPPPAWWGAPPPAPGFPTWAIALIVVVVVLLVIGTIVMFAFVTVTTLEPPPGPSKPVMTFTSTSPISNGFSFDVAGASQSLPASNYRVTLQVGGTAGTAVALVPSMSFTVSGNTYTITWTDVGGENNVNQGDQFRATRTGGLPNATEFTVHLLWSDGSQIQSASYTSP